MTDDKESRSGDEVQGGIENNEKSSQSSPSIGLARESSHVSKGGGDETDTIATAKKSATSQSTNDSRKEVSSSVSNASGDKRQSSSSAGQHRKKSKRSKATSDDVVTGESRHMKRKPNLANPSKPPAGRIREETSHTMSPRSSKRSSNREDSPGPTPEDLARMSRSERKRHREKKRRSDVNRGFDDLTALLIQIDPSIKAEAEEDRARKTASRSSAGQDGDSSLLLNRVELISRAVTVLERIHRENEERKLLIAELTNRLGGGGRGSAVGAGEEQVMMMVPTLTPLDTLVHAASRGRLPMQPHYNAFSSSFSHGHLTGQAAAFPPGQFLGYGAQGLTRHHPGRTTESSMPPSGAGGGVDATHNGDMDYRTTTHTERDYRHLW